MGLKIEKLTKEAFEPYGTCINIHEGYSSDSVSFQPDRILQHVGCNLTSLCSIRLNYRPLRLELTEFHDDCEEVFGGFSCDIAFHVGLLGKDSKPDVGSIKVFLLPAGGFARVKRRVLHHAGFVLKQDHVADGLIFLSPSAYTIDCKVLHFDNIMEVEL